MHELMAWCGFLGAWFLFAGPIYQAAIELQEEEFQREEFAAVVDAVPPDPISPWWWLLPPVMWIKHARRSQAHQYRILTTMTPEQVEAFVSFSAKSTGWFMVGAGGLLIAVKESYALVETMQWPLGVAWLLALGMGILSVSNAVVRMRRGQQVVQLRREAGGQRDEPATPPSP